MSERAGGFGAALVGIGLIGLVVLGVAVWRSMAPPAPDVDPPEVGVETQPLPELERPVARSEDPEPDLTPEALEVQAATLAGEEGVVCRIEPPVHGGTARLVLDGDPGTWLAVAAAQAHVLVLSDIPESGSGTLLVEGFAPAPLRWSGARAGAGACTPDPVALVPAEAAVVGTLRGNAHGVGITACGQRVRIDDEGGFYAAAVPGVSCEVEARRHFGVWEWLHEQQVTPRTGADTVVQIDAPEFEAVLPLLIEDGRIQAVWGVAPKVDVTGGRVLEVDGEAVPADADGFHFATGGAEGDVAEVRVSHPDGARTVQLARRALGFEDWLAH